MEDSKSLITIAVVLLILAVFGGVAALGFGGFGTGYALMGHNFAPGLGYFWIFGLTIAILIIIILASIILGLGRKLKGEKDKK